MDKESRNQPQLEVSSSGHMWNFSTLRSPGAEKLSLACSGHARPRSQRGCTYVHCLLTIVCLRKACRIFTGYLFAHAQIFESVDLHLGESAPAPSQVLPLQGAAHFCVSKLVSTPQSS